VPNMQTLLRLEGELNELFEANPIPSQYLPPALQSMLEQTETFIRYVREFTKVVQEEKGKRPLLDEAFQHLVTSGKGTAAAINACLQDDEASSTIDQSPAKSPESVTNEKQISRYDSISKRERDSPSPTRPRESYSSPKSTKAGSPSQTASIRPVKPSKSTVKQNQMELFDVSVWYTGGNMLRNSVEIIIEDLVGLTSFVSNDKMFLRDEVTYELSSEHLIPFLTNLRKKLSDNDIQCIGGLKVNGKSILEGWINT